MLTRLADTYYTFRFVKLLATKWEDLPAVQLGIIDETGKKLKQPSGPQEREAYTPFIKLVVKLKILLDKIPFGKTTIAKYATALWLLKEETSVDLELPFIAYLNETYDIKINTSDVITESSNKYTRLFGMFFEQSGSELVLVEDMGTAGIDMVDKPLGEEPESFADTKVFTCNTETFLKCRLGKTPYARYSSFVGSDELGCSIRNYCISNPKKSVILKDEITGAMLYLRKR